MMADAKPVIVQAGIDQGFKITPLQLEERDHAEDAPPVAEQPLEPDRRRVHRRRAEGAGRGAEASIRAS